jgi:hypothetical protein
MLATSDLGGHAVSDEHMIPWEESATISVESIARALKTFEESRTKAKERMAAEYEIVLPLGVHPDLREIEGIKVSHHLACPEGQALILNKGLLQRKHEAMMKAIFDWPREHWLSMPEEKLEDRMRRMAREFEERAFGA